jgi:hypothetical protein
MSNQLHYGVVTDDEISLRGPKMIDEGPFTSKREAFIEAIDHILNDPDGFAKVVVCKLEDPNDPYWVEDWNYAGIKIDASNSDWVYDDGESE